MSDFFPFVGTDHQTLQRIRKNI